MAYEHLIAFLGGRAGSAFRRRLGDAAQALGRGARRTNVRAWCRRLSARRARAADPFRYVFIVTYARSGSTLLQAVLGGLFGFWMMGENADALGGLFDSYRAAKHARDVQGTERRTARGDPWRGAHRIEPDRYAVALARAFVDEILQPPKTARVVGFKEVRYFDRLDELHAYLAFMQRVFAPSLVVFNKRSAEDVARSGWWREHDTTELIAEVLRFDRLAEEYAAAHADRALIVDYDAYCRDVNALQPLFAMLRRPLDPDGLRRVLAERLTH
jgi:hypothetical protein